MTSMSSFKHVDSSSPTAPTQSSPDPRETESTTSSTPAPSIYGVWYRVADGTRVFVDKVEDTKVHGSYYTGTYGVKKMQSKWFNKENFLRRHTRESAPKPHAK
jgi:hypothetical protein